MKKEPNQAIQTLLDKVSRVMNEDGDEDGIYADLFNRLEGITDMNTPSAIQAIYDAVNLVSSY